MSVWFEQPVVALLALGVVLVGAGLVIYARGRGRSARWWMAGVVLPLGAVVLMGLALARPVVSVARGGSRESGRVVILLDLSASTRTSPWRDPAWVRDLARRRLGGEVHVMVVGFAARPVVMLDDVGVGEEGRWPARWPVMEADEETDVEGALRWRMAEELAMAGQPAIWPRWVVTDGIAANPRDVPECALGVTVVSVREVDVGVRQMTLRPVAEGVVEILVQVAATGKAGGEVVVSRDHREIARIPSVFAGPSTRWVTVHDAVSGAGVHEYEAVIRRESGTAVGGDPWPENDGAEVLYVSGGERRILRIGRGAESALVPGATWVKPEEFREDAGMLSRQGYQAVVLEDVPAELGADGRRGAGVQPLPAAGARSLERFVRETGAGLLILGHEHAFGPGFYGAGSATGEILEGLSPVLSRLPESAGIHVVLVLDASGSMNESEQGRERKFKVLARGVMEAAALLPAKDRVTVIVFNGEARLVADGLAGEIQSTVADGLAGIEPTGPTQPDAALGLMAEALGNDGAARRKVVLLTDGEIPTMDVPRWKALLGDDRTMLTVIAPAGATESPLKRLAGELGPGCRWLPTADAGVWGSLLRLTVESEVAGRAMTTRESWRTAGMDPRTSGMTREWTEVWGRRESNTLAESTDASARAGQVLAAEVQRGLGKVAAVAMMDDSPENRQLVREVLGRIAAVAGDRRFVLEAKPGVAGGWLLTADGVEGGKFLDHERLAARVLVGGDSSDVMVPMMQTGPGHYEARVDEGAAFTVVVVRQGAQAAGGGEKEELVGRIQPARVAVGEYPATVEARSFLLRGGVRLSADPGDEFRWRSSAAAWRMELGPYLWFAAAVACLAALFLRRERGSRSAIS